MRRLLLFLEDRSAPQIAFLCLALIAVLAVIDYATGPDLSVFIFYLVPVFLSTWLISNIAGILMSLLSAVAWSLSDLLSSRTYSDAIIPYWNLLMELLFFLIIVYLLSLLKGSLEHERRMARTDPLTGAVNSRHFRDLAQTEISRAGRYGHVFTFVYFDVDDFKAVNDRYGHSEGDVLLKLTVTTIHQHIRASDLLARIGGDEFVMLLPETDRTTARSVLGKVRRELDQAVQARGWTVTFSFGMMTFNEAPVSLHEMMKRTDELMYRSKREGKNRVCDSEYGEAKTEGEEHDNRT